MKMRFIDYFDRISIIHLPERTDRYEALECELKCIDIDIKHPKVRNPLRAPARRRLRLHFQGRLRQLPEPLQHP